MTEKKLIKITLTALVEIEDDRAFQEEFSLGNEDDNGAMWYAEDASIEFLRDDCSTPEELIEWLCGGSLKLHKDNIQVEELDDQAFEAAKKELP